MPVGIVQAVFSAIWHFRNMQFNVIKFSERLKDLRLSKGLSTIQLGKELGIPNSTISRWENGLRIPGIDNLFILASFFNVSAGYLIGKED